MNDTRLFDIADIKKADIEITLKEVVFALEEAGYQPINQLVGYLISADPGYITSKMDARKKITSLDRTDIVEELLRSYLEKE